MVSMVGNGEAGQKEQCGLVAAAAAALAKRC